MARLSGFLCRLTSWKRELVSEPSLTGSRFSQYFIFIPLSDNRHGYINENSFIENLAASKYSMWAPKGKMIYSGYGKYSDPLTFFTLCYIVAIC